MVSLHAALACRWRANWLTPVEAGADVINALEAFLPQPLACPNSADPLNGEAAALMLRDPDKYEAKIREVRLRPALFRRSGGCACYALLAIRLASPSRESARRKRRR